MPRVCSWLLVHTVLCGECFICCNFCLRVLCCRHIYCSCRPAIERRHAVALSIRRAKSQKISPEVALARLLASNDDVPEEVLLRRLTAGARSAAASPYGSDAPASLPSISSLAPSSTSSTPAVSSAGLALPRPLNCTPPRPLFSSASFSGPLNFFPCPFASNGVPCPRGSFVHAPYCRFHLRSVLGLDVDESTIPDAGFGLFSLVARPKGFHLVDYLGEVVSNTVIEQRYPKKTLGAYSLKLSASLFLDSALSRGVGACANAPGKVRPNVCFVAHAGSKSARLEVVRPIKPGEEIFVSYGRDYWRKATRPTSQSMFLTGSGISPILLPAFCSCTYSCHRCYDCRPFTCGSCPCRSSTCCSLASSSLPNFLPLL